MDYRKFNKFKKINNKYLPKSGEGTSMVTQIVTAVNKLVYKWFNDGDVYDNTYLLESWCNDLSSYANWLEMYVPETKAILRRIEGCMNGDEYEHILYDLATLTLNEDFLARYDKPKAGTIYECDGYYKFNEDGEDEE